jgi:hypothetical protein
VPDFHKIILENEFNISVDIRLRALRIVCLAQRFTGCLEEIRSIILIGVSFFEIDCGEPFDLVEIDVAIMEDADLEILEGPIQLIQILER